MSDNNLSIWEKVEETSLKATKTVALEGRTVTSLNGTAMFKEATKLWGPVGIGWGYEILEEVFQHGGPIVDDDKQKIADNMIHTIKLELWYKQGNEIGKVVHFGHTPFIYKTKWGPKTDFEAPKKSLTDAIKKCLSMLGFSADVYMGMFDDQEYVDSIAIKEKIQDAEDSSSETLTQRDEFRTWMEKELGAYPLIPNKASLKLVCQGHLNSAKLKCQAVEIPFEAVEKSFISARDKQAAVIDKKRNEKKTED
jgi:hypothetical protein